MEITDESRAQYFEMLAAFKATLTSTYEQMVFEEAITHDSNFIQARYEDWLLQTDLSVSSRNVRLQTLDKLMIKLFK